MKNRKEKSVCPIKELTAAEREKLIALEVEIDRGAKAFVEVGAALREIRNTRLYRQSHGTFEDYVRDRFSFERGHAYNLIASVDACDNLATAQLVKPTNEYQLRPLIKLSPENQIKAWSIAANEAGDGKITHDLVSAAVEDIEGKSKSQQFVSESIDSAADQAEIEYLHGPISEHVGKIEKHSVDLLIVSHLNGKTGAESADALDKIIQAIECTLKADSQALVFVDDFDTREILDVAEARGFEVGVPVVRDRGKSRSASGFSFQNAAQIILHFRKGKAKLVDRVSNIIFGEDESPRLHSTQLPTVLLTDLISSAVPAGAVVLDPTAGIGSTLSACGQIGRRGIGIEPNEKAYKLGLRFLKIGKASTAGGDHE